MNVATALLPLPSRNRGAALLLLLLFLVIGFTAYLMSSFSPNSLEVQRQRKTLEALAKAKEALIAWSVVNDHTDIEKEQNKRPGSLPCPGANLIDNTDYGIASDNCSSLEETAIGRLPWKTLGIEKLTDGHGEQLWYVVSDNFRLPDTTPLAINSSSTMAALQLYAADGSTLLTKQGEELAAIVFSPGPSLSGQNRTATSNDARNYLDSGHGRNNASAAGPFIAGPVKDAQGNIIVNDLIIGISTKELLTAIEKRVLGEIRGSNGYGLRQYYEKEGKLPWASGSFDGSADDTPSGGLPYKELTIAPAWLTANEWPPLINYQRCDDKLARISVGNSKMEINFGSSAICP